MRTTALLLLLALLLSAAPVTAQPDGDEGYTGAGLVGRSEPVHDGSVVEVLEIPTDHGTLYGEVIRPVVPDGVQVPVILTYSPYNVLSQALTANGSIADDAVAAYYVPRGYARAVFDVVGTRNSGGCYDYGGLGERETGAALVDALGSQPWSNGRVGMIGGSYDGTTQWAAAVEQPEHLVTIVPQVAIDRWYDYAFGGGIRYFLNSEDPSDEGFDTPLAFDFGFGFLPPVDPTRPSPELQLEALEGRFNPCERIEHTQRAYEFDPVYDAFWDERDYLARAQDITASVLVEGGWLDHNVKHWDSTRMFAALPEDLPRHLVMGQWAHSANQHDDAADLRHAWFDHWLLGLDTGVEDLPLVDTQMGGSGERSAETAWPPADTTTAQLPLTADGEGLVLEGAEVPTWHEQGAATTEAEVMASTTSARGTYVHLLTPDPLEAPVRITGSPTLRLEVVTEGTSAHLTPVLYEQRADGSTAVITRGFLNARNREGLDVSSDVPAGTPYTATVELWDVDFEVAEGSRIGLALASHLAEWVLTDDDEQGATTLLAGGASVLSLPVNRGHAEVGAPLPDVPDGPAVDRVAGSGRIETAAAVSARAADSADVVVIATAADYPDALTAGPLARALDAPLLLTDPDGLSRVSAEEVERLGATQAVLVGGEDALSAAVAADLADRDVTTRRVAGPDRFATAAAIAEEVVAAADPARDVIPYVVEGEHTDPARGWPDAVATAPLAAAEGQPILLVNATRLPAATVQALDAVAATSVAIVGGPAAVSQQVAADLAAAGHDSDRLAGPTRYATSALLHDRMVGAGLDGAEVWLATGADWPDALTAGPSVAGLGHTLALVDGADLDASPETRDLLGPGTRAVHLLGGVATISDRVLEQVADLLSG